jgi:EmrB/QacA subfamily drug resistance transporter
MISPEKNIQIPSAQEKRIVLITASAGSFFVPFMTSAVNVAVPAVARHFSLSGVMLTWVATSFILASAMFLVPFSRAADMFGRKKVFLLGMTGFTLATVLCGVSVSMHMLVVSRFLQGVCAAGIFGTSMSIVTSVFPPGERGRALGIVAASVYVGLFLGPTIGGLLTAWLGWRSIFFVSAVMSGAVAVMTTTMLKGEWHNGVSGKFDLAGSAMYSLSLVCLMYGCSVLPGVHGIVFTCAGLAGLSVFWIFETRVKNPVFDTRLFSSNRVFAFSNVTALLNYGATFAVTFLVSLYLQYNKGLNPAHAGTILLSAPLVQAAISPFAGRLSDRFEPRVISSLGMAMCCAGLVSLSFLNAESGVVSIITRLVLLGAGFALFGSPNTNAVMSSVEKKNYGVASGTLGTMRLMGQMISMVIITAVLVLHLGQAKITPDLYPRFLSSMKLAFGIFSALCFAGIFSSLARGNIREKQIQSDKDTK